MTRIESSKPNRNRKAHICVWKPIDDNDKQINQYAFNNTHLNATRKVKSIFNDKIHKNTIEVNYQTSCVQSIWFRILYGFVDLQIQPQSNRLWSTQQNLFQKVIKRFNQTYWSHNRRIQQFLNEKERERERERESTQGFV